MKLISHSTLASLAIFVFGMIGLGCGGGGGSSSGGGGGNIQTITGEINITGGTLVNTIPNTGAQSVVVKDQDNDQFTLANVFVPHSVNFLIPVVVIKAGSKLLDGHYTSTTATYINPGDNAETPFTLTADHKVAQDTLVLPAATIRLPIDQIGNYSFPNGIVVRVDGGMTRVEVANLKFVGKANLSDFTASTKLTFTGSGSPTGSAAMVFQGTGSVSVQPPLQGASPFTSNGVSTGTDTEFPTAGVTYHYDSN